MPKNKSSHARWTKVEKRRQEAEKARREEEERQKAAASEGQPEQQQGQPQQEEQQQEQQAKQQELQPTQHEDKPLTQQEQQPAKREEKPMTHGKRPNPEDEPQPHEKRPKQQVESQQEKQQQQAEPQQEKQQHQQQQQEQKPQQQAGLPQQEKQQQQHEQQQQQQRQKPQGPSRRLLVLLHGEKANDDLIRDAIRRVRSDGHKVAVRVTYEAGDVDRLVAEALKLGTADTLVAAGGDGTVNEVVAAILRHTGGLLDTRQSSVSEICSRDNSFDLDEYEQHQLAAPDARLDPKLKAKAVKDLRAGMQERAKHVTMAILPMGTSNDFAATTGIPQDPYEALLLATRPECAKPIDVGLVNNRIFMNTATVGASADVGKLTSSAVKKVFGPAAFLLTGARTMISWHPHTSKLRFPNLAPPSSGDASAMQRPPGTEPASAAQLDQLPGAPNVPAGPASTTAAAPASTTAASPRGNGDDRNGDGSKTGTGVGDVPARLAREGTKSEGDNVKSEGGDAKNEGGNVKSESGDVKPLQSLPSERGSKRKASEGGSGSGVGGEASMSGENGGGQANAATGGTAAGARGDVGAGTGAVDGVPCTEKERSGVAATTETAASLAAAAKRVGQEVLGSEKNERVRGGGGGVGDSSMIASPPAQNNGRSTSSSNVPLGLNLSGVGATGSPSVAASTVPSEAKGGVIDTRRSLAEGRQVLKSARSFGGAVTPRQQAEHLHGDSKSATLQRSSSVRNSSGKAVRVGGGWASAPPLPPAPPPQPVQTPRSNSLRNSSLRSSRSGGVMQAAIREAAAAAAVAANSVPSDEAPKSGDSESTKGVGAAIMNEALSAQRQQQQQQQQAACAISDKVGTQHRVSDAMSSSTADLSRSSTSVQPTVSGTHATGSNTNGSSTTNGNNTAGKSNVSDQATGNTNGTNATGNGGLGIKRSTAADGAAAAAAAAAAAKDAVSTEAPKSGNEDVPAPEPSAEPEILGSARDRSVNKLAASAVNQSQQLQPSPRASMRGSISRTSSQRRVSAGEDLPIPPGWGVNMRTGLAEGAQGWASSLRSSSTTPRRTITPRKRGSGTGGGATVREDGGKHEGHSTITVPSQKIEEATPPQPPSNVAELQDVPLLHVTAANNRQIASMVAVSPNALLDDGLLDVVYLTGTPGQQVKRVFKDFLRKGWAGTRSVPCLLRVPWLEIETDEPLEWSLDGEPAAHPSNNLRLSLLHRAIMTHLPDDRMLMAGNQSGDAAVAAAVEGKGQRRRQRVLRSLLRPGPTIGELLGSVVVFKKKRDWRKVVLGTLGSTVKATALVAMGGAAVHAWHNRRQQQDGSDREGVRNENREGQRSRRGWAAAGL